MTRRSYRAQRAAGALAITAVLLLAWSLSGRPTDADADLGVLGQGRTGTAERHSSRLEPVRLDSRLVDTSEPSTLEPPAESAPSNGIRPPGRIAVLPSLAVVADGQVLRCPVPGVGAEILAEGELRIPRSQWQPGRPVVLGGQALLWNETAHAIVRAEHGTGTLIFGTLAHATVRWEPVSGGLRCTTISPIGRGFAVSGTTVYPDGELAPHTGVLGCGTFTYSDDQGNFFLTAATSACTLRAVSLDEPANILSGPPVEVEQSDLGDTLVTLEVERGPSQ